MVVLALVGNNDEMYEYEEVSEEEGISLAREINAIHQRISSKNDFEKIEKLFKKIGEKFLELKNNRIIKKINYLNKYLNN